MAIHSPVDFFLRIVEPNMEEHRRDRLDLRKAFNAAVALWSMKDWVWEAYHDKPGWRYGNEQQFAEELHRRCTALRHMRDVANAVKHLELDPPKTISNIRQVRVSGGSGFLGMGPLGGGPIGSAPEIQISGDKGIRIFAHDAESVLQMWRTLFSENGWLN